MTRIACVADVHVHSPTILGGERWLGLNARGWSIVETLRAATSVALEGNARWLIVAGDLFDTHRTAPQVIAAVAEVFAAFIDATEGKGCVYLVRGNHDAASEEPGDSALAPLAHVDGVRVIDKACGVRVPDCAVVFLPYQTGPANSWVEVELSAARGTLGPNMRSPVLAIVHAGIRDEVAARNPWAAAAEDAVDLDILRGAAADAGVCCVLAGNWHDYHAWETDGICPRVVQLGALCPTGWDNPGLDGYGGVEIWDSARPTETERYELPGPRFVYRLPDASAAAAGHKVYVHLRVPREESAAVRADVAAAKARGEIQGGIVTVVGEGNGEAVRATVARAADAESLAGAVDSWLRRHKKLPVRIEAMTRAACARYLTRR